VLKAKKDSYAFTVAWEAAIAPAKVEKRKKVVQKAKTKTKTKAKSESMSTKATAPRGSVILRTGRISIPTAFTFA
jgi:hypothetical protein